MGLCFSKSKCNEVRDGRTRIYKIGSISPVSLTNLLSFAKRQQINNQIEEVILPTKIKKEKKITNKMSSFIPNYFKTKVSKNRKRHKEFGLDLDLTYITERIIAMAFPAERMESIYRNRLNDVYEFLEKKHKDHYYIYNLCSERSYDKAKFYNRVKVYPFEDHNPPSFPVIGSFCRDVDRVLQDDPENVVAIHCKAGKGRTGTMICCYLLHCGKFATAEEAIEYYGQVRTEDGRGVTIPSQIRYVKYYEQFLREEQAYHPTSVCIKRVHLRPPPKFADSAVLTVKEKIFECPGHRERVLQQMMEDRSSATEEEVEYEGKYPWMDEGKKIEIPAVKDRSNTEYVVEYPTCSNSGDIRLELFYRSPVFTKKKRLARVWINSYFAEKNGLPCAVGARCRDLVFRKEELDVAWKKDRKHRLLSADFELKIHLEVPAETPENFNSAEQSARTTPEVESQQEPLQRRRERRDDNESSGAEEDSEEENDCDSGKSPSTSEDGGAETGNEGARETVNEGASTSTGTRFQPTSRAVDALKHDARRKYSNSSASESSTSQSVTVETAYYMQGQSSASSATPASLLDTPVDGGSGASTALARSPEDLDAVTTAPESDEDATSTGARIAAHGFPCTDLGPRPFRKLAPAPSVKIFGLFQVKRRRYIVVES